MLMLMRVFHVPFVASMLVRLTPTNRYAKLPAIIKTRAYKMAIIRYMGDNTGAADAWMATHTNTTSSKLTSTSPFTSVMSCHVVRSPSACLLLTLFTLIALLLNHYATLTLTSTSTSPITYDMTAFHVRAVWGGQEYTEICGVEGVPDEYTCRRRAHQHTCGLPARTCTCAI